MTPETLPSKRSASISEGSSPTKRARSFSNPLKVGHVKLDIPVKTKNPQACLGGVPEELLLNILQQLHDSPATLGSLCRTDRRCNRVVEEVLYSDVSAHAYGKVRAMNGTPRLAWNVRSCTADIIDDFRMADYKKLIASSPNIRSLTLLDLSNPPRGYTEQGMHLSIGWLPLFYAATSLSDSSYVNQFTHLRELTIAGDYFSIENLSVVFRLPSLQVLELNTVHQTKLFKYWNITDSSSSIQVLRLLDSMIDIAALTKIVSAMKALRSFTYIRSTIAWEPFGVEHNPFSCWPSHSWQLLGDALRKHRNSLETVLTWDTSDKEIVDIVYPDGYKPGTLGSFLDFPKLRHCGGQVEAFLDVSAGEDDLMLYLPPYLSRFDIHMSSDNSTSWDIHLTALASLRRMVGAGTGTTVQLTWDGDLPTRMVPLSNALAFLEQAGTKLCLDINERSMTVEKLKELEAGTDGKKTQVESAQEEQDNGDGYDQDDNSDQMSE
ncbi:hypothetical protein GMOD_00002076 [Pyrenophora seminiperda CCB06]|uniref:F-box domain-containing protein n=1 Tax=Pyrenophora seminiperda CCB06 TaxID=1302712 RepID=A0A3M7LWX1_9PLEO|nr:hypothetical protein GMOD_00002076 [Pyrenophora seminiperda CCB06]